MRTIPRTVAPSNPPAERRPTLKPARGRVQARRRIVREASARSRRVPTVQTSPCVIAAASDVASLPFEGPLAASIVSDAYALIERVRVHFAAQPDGFLAFLRVLSDWQSSRIHVSAVIRSVDSLFADNPHLLQELRLFLHLRHVNVAAMPAATPEAHCGKAASPQDSAHAKEYVLCPAPASPASRPSYIAQRPPSCTATSGSMPTAPATEPGTSLPLLRPQSQLVLQPVWDVPTRGEEHATQSKFDQGLDFLADLRQRFATQPFMYANFLSILSAFSAKPSIGTTEVIRRVGFLFQRHPDLIARFNIFLPSGYVVDAHANPISGHVLVRYRTPGRPFVFLSFPSPLVASPESVTHGGSEDAAGSASWSNTGGRPKRARAIVELRQELQEARVDEEAKGKAKAKADIVAKAEAKAKRKSEAREQARPRANVAQEQAATAIAETVEAQALAKTAAAQAHAAQAQAQPVRAILAESRV